MAAGAIPIAHNSAGPKMDIVLDEDGQQTGFLAQNVEEYADAVLKIVKMPEFERLKIQHQGEELADFQSKDFTMISKPQSDQLYAVLPSYRIALEDHTDIENKSYTCSCLLGFFTLSIQSLEKA
ncbi:hypothetical protein GOBAR_DD05341 [Gossypium barbadense]|nr:hypothetical protein GOBAR_DD05341 [Gossypium barbadense]